MKNLISKIRLGSTWISDVSVPELVRRKNHAFSMTEKSRAFAINRASALDFRGISGGHAAASKAFSFVRTTFQKLFFSF